MISIDPVPEGPDTLTGIRATRNSAPRPTRCRVPTTKADPARTDPVKTLLSTIRVTAWSANGRRCISRIDSAELKKIPSRKNFVDAGRADGYEFAVRITQKCDVQTLRDFVDCDGPAFVEVMIDSNANVYPMVGPGLSYQEMVTGPPHIAARFERTNCF